MSYRVKVLGSETALPTTIGAATSFSSATVIRLVNTSTSNDHLVTVVESQSGPGIGSFTLMRGTTEYLQKQSSHCVLAASTDVKGVQVGFTN